MFETDAFNRSLFFPRPVTSPCPASARDVQVVVEGARLHLRIHSGVHPRANVLLFHGNGEVVADYDDSAAQYAKVGAALAVMDFRGYGASTGTPTLRAIIHDAPDVTDALLATVDGPVIVMGRSLGSACANHLYPLHLHGHSRVCGFILESGFTDLDALAGRRQLSSRDITDDERALVDPLPKLRKGDAPMLVLHGALDTLIVPSEARAAFESAGGEHKRLVMVEGRGHNDISRSDAYWSALERFVDSVSG